MALVEAVRSAFSFDPPISGVREVELPATFRELSSLSRIDYADAFFVPLENPKARAAEEWVRHIVDQTSVLWRTTLPLGWFSLGLRLASPRDPRRVMGWQVTHASSDFVVLAGSSRIGMPAELVLARTQTGLLFATLVQHENLLARSIWAGMEEIHRQVVRRVLQAAQR